MSWEIPKLIRRSPVIRVDVELKSDVGNAIQRLGGFEFIGILVKNVRRVSYTVQFFETGEGKWDTSISTNRIGCFIRAQAGKLISL